MNHSPLLRLKSILGALLSLAVLAIVSGCIGLREVKTPMPYLFDAAPGTLPTTERVLIVFLPGAQEVPEDLVREGFVRQVRERRLAADVVIADAHAGYHFSNTFHTRLRADVIAPLRAKGYKQVWLAGISLGGFGSIWYSRWHAADVNGIIAIAPFIGSNSVLREVEEAGGLKAWAPATIDEKDWQRDLLRWIKGYADPSQPRPPLYVGYGTQDGFDQFNTLIGPVLPRERVRSAPGKHDWPPWKQLWGEFLDQVKLPTLPPS